ncbi:MAG TPA: SIR2 family protein [Solirubrobacteraceae bacterium]|nr:SIR2 family protein [Solirubrobacteraceae bacterium]
MGQSEVEMTPGNVRVFINYRHDDADGEAMLVYERLADRFGADNVFLDNRSLKPGMKWLEEIKAHAGVGVFVSLIGERWLPSMKARAEAAVADPKEDYVRIEIEYALRRRSGLRVIPVLIGDAVPPPREALPKSLEEITMIEAERVQLKHLDEDVKRLGDRIVVVAAQPEELPEPTPPPPPENGGEPPERRHTSSTANAIAPAPDSAHFRQIVRHIVDEGNLVPVLGLRMGEGHRGAQSLIEATQSLPDAEELAAGLAQRFNLAPRELDLAQVAQYVYITRGRPDLYMTLKQMLTNDCEPGALHQFLARIPETLRGLGQERKYQLIVTTNFDTALEQAFDEADEEYDLAVYMASGDDKGHFVHFPYDGDPVPIVQPNKYGGFPIGDYGELERTVIVKIHGAVDGNRGEYRWKENYVITEDHYIDYLSVRPIGDVVPIQILDKLRNSHCLFLGYTMRDWNLRVFLKRIWTGQPLDTKSWAVQREPDMLEREFWAHYLVDLYASDLRAYADRLSRELGARAPAGATP